MRTEFFSWRKHAKITHSPHLLLYTAPATPATSAKTDRGRVSVVIPKKVNKLATGRNALRRVILDTLLPLTVSAKMDAVLFIKSASPIETLLSELSLLFSNLKANS